MVECEFFFLSIKLYDIWVLIDTWWNVNVKEVSQIITNDNVLIDTWWNVNIFSQFLHYLSSGFNRYMVECE